MGILSNFFGGSAKPYQAQSGLQPGELEQMSKERQAAIEGMGKFAEAAKTGGLLGLTAQENLLPKLEAMAAGKGPSVVENLLNQYAGDIGTQQAAAAASQRGASQNVGLVGRQAARGAADIYQRAASEMATARTREQMAAIEQLRQLAQQQAQQYQTGTQAYGQTALEAQRSGLQAQAQQEAQRTAMAQQQMQQQGGLLGGLLGGTATVLSSGLLKGSPAAAAPVGGMSTGANIRRSVPMSYADGGVVDQNDQRPPEEKEMDIVSMLLESQPKAMAHGAKVPGKAQVDGDSYKNDTVPALLSPGEIVVPRSAARDPEKAAAFAKSVSMRSKRRKK